MPTAESISTGSKQYIELLQNFPPRPITSEAELTATQVVIDDLLDESSLTPAQQDYLNLLGILVYEYEEKHIPIADLSGLELLKALIEEMGLKQKDLVPVFKTESITSEILNGKRKFTVEHIEKLSAFFKVPTSAFFVS